MSKRLGRMLISNASLYDPLQQGWRGWLLVEGKQIKALGFGLTPDFDPGELEFSLDAGGRALLPGFIDLHAHGAQGYEVMDGSSGGLVEISRFYAQHGVTGFLATTWTASPESLRCALETIAGIAGPVEGGATILGAHLEGPYLNPARAGAQAAAYIRKADQSEALLYLQSGVVKLWALAPEFPENLWLVDICVKLGVTTSAAHTNASYEEMQEAVRHGLRHVTHSYNAMQGLGHRAPGTVGALLSMPELSVELIADNVHVHPAAQKILVDTKSPARVILVTDSIRPNGLPPGEYMLDDRPVRIQDGAVRLLDGTLAGSVLTMERALQNLIAATGRSLSEVWQTSSLNAARQIGISAQKGSLEAGKDADLVLLNPDFSVALTVVEGRVVYQH